LERVTALTGDPGEAGVAVELEEGVDLLGDAEMRECLTGKLSGLVGGGPLAEEWEGGVKGRFGLVEEENDALEGVDRRGMGFEEFAGVEPELAAGGGGGELVIDADVGGAFGEDQDFLVVREHTSMSVMGGRFGGEVKDPNQGRGGWEVHKPD